MLLLITTVVAALLALTNSLTKDKIAEGTRQKAEAAMREVLPAEHYEELPAQADGITAAYLAKDAGYVVRVAAGGFGGAIDMMVGIDNNLHVTGVSIISHAETASLGANCTREEFRAQYIGATGTLSVNKDGGEIEALTGATVTSRAVTDGVNLALDFVKGVRK